MTWYHGGIPGLLPGDHIEPPSTTGARQALSYLPPTVEVPEPVADPDWVYITSDRALATIFAAGVNGSVYAVEPEGAIEPDPDYTGADDSSHRCHRARITAVVRARIARADIRAVRRLAIEALKETADA